VGHVAHMREMRNAYRILVGKPEWKRPLGRPRRRWEDNIRVDLREVEKSRDSAVGIALGYGPDPSSIPGGGGAGHFFLHHRVENGSGAHPASYPMGTRGSFVGGKTARS
jgi:hypothetical protein